MLLIAALPQVLRRSLTLGIPSRRLGTRQGNWIPLEDVAFNTSADEGHFPCRIFRANLILGVRGVSFPFLASRLVRCKI